MTDENEISAVQEPSKTEGQVQVKEFCLMSSMEFVRIVVLRKEVFEGKEEIEDGRDFTAWHLWSTDGDKLTGCARIVRQDEETVDLDQMAILNQDKGVEKQMVAGAIEAGRKMEGVKRIKVETETEMQELYESLGFRTITEPFVENGKMYVEMGLEW